MLLQSIMLLLLASGTCCAAQEIVVGTTLPLHAEGKQIEMGIQAAFKPLTQFKLLALDDNKNLTKALRNITQLQENTPYFLEPFTPGIVQALMPKLQAGEIVVFGPDENSTRLYQNKPANLILTRPSLRDELGALVRHAVKSLKKHKVALFYVDSPYGREAILDARAALKQYNLMPVAEVSYPHNTVEIHRAVADIEKAQPDAIICLGRRHAVYNFLLEVVNKGLIRTAFLGTSYLLPIQQFLKEARGIDLIATSVVPNPWRSIRPQVQQYRAAMHALYPDEPYSPISLESYLSAQLFARIIQGIVGPATPAAVAQAANARTLAMPIWLCEEYGKPWRLVQR